MDFLKIAKDDANLVSLSSSFHNFAPRYENAFWPVLVLSRGICKLVSVERRMRSLPSEHLLKVPLNIEEQVSSMPYRSALLFQETVSV